MTPSEFRSGGSDADIFFAIGECSLASILVAKSKRGVCAIFLGNDPTQLIRELQDQFSRATLIVGKKGFEELVAKVIGFIEQPGIGLNLPLDIRGTAFQQRVWRALRQIPVGSTASYAEMAERIGRPKAVGAVAQACSANSWPWRSRVVASSEPTARYRAIAGVWSGNALFLAVRHTHEHRSEEL